jgi:hypothetical protein
VRRTVTRSENNEADDQATGSATHARQSFMTAGRRAGLCA